jgi:hypothetical protein
MTISAMPFERRRPHARRAGVRRVAPALCRPHLSAWPKRLRGRTKAEETVRGKNVQLSPPLSPPARARHNDE